MNKEEDLKKVVIGLVVGTLAFAACSKGKSDSGDGSNTSASCAPSGTELKLTAKSAAFDKNCLAVTADTAFTVALDNKDGFPHNFSILEKKGGDEIFKGTATAEGGKVTNYDVPAISAGKHYFQCDFHPDMNGTFISQ